ncbi:flagellar brake protein [Dechloromonas sp. ZY10]|uniref:flagellar brake protein n=1 Tax=Dechloromonas aquae TaxID=2664436 RepID=UPI0035281635
MLDDGKKFVRLTIDDIEIGKPLRWAIYNGDKELIFGRGEAIPTRAEAEAAIAKGWFRLFQDGDLAPLPTAIRPLTSRVERSPLRDAVIAQQQSAVASGASASAAAAPAKKNDKPSVVALEAARIQVGDTIQLQGSADASQRYLVRLIGYAKNAGVIVSVPEVNGAPVILREGQAFVGRFFSGLSAYAFPTSVLRQTNVPYPHLHLAYPREVGVQEVRKSPRIDTELIAALSLPSGKEGAGKIIDLSATGAGLRTKQAVAGKGDQILAKFKVSVQGLDTVLALTAEVCNARVDADQAMPHFLGLRFVDVEASAQFALTAFVYGRLVGEN